VSVLSSLMLGCNFAGAKVGRPLNYARDGLRESWSVGKRAQAVANKVPDLLILILKRSDLVKDKIGFILRVLP